MIQIEKTSEDGLTTETWRFTLIDKLLVLDDYLRVIRPTRRHKGKAIGHYNRLSARDSTLKEADVPWSADLAEEVLRRHMATLRVGRWQIDFGH